MQILKLTLGAMLAFGASVALAQTSLPSCASGETEISDTSALLAGKFVCAARSGETWQEFHQTGGMLFDWKLGPGSTMDPTKQVGTWSTATGTVTHTYGATAYTWRVCRTSAGNNPQYTLRSASGGNVVGVTVVSGSFNQVNKPCP